MQNEITDEEFVPFLHSLGVETYKKSFEWMLSDPAFAGVFSWLYNNLDQNNALTAREEYRYAELQKAEKLLSLEDLETTISTIQQDFPGICLPGDQGSLEDVKQDIDMQKERLHMLDKQEKITKKIMKQNELVREQLTIEVTKLNAAQQQCIDEEASAASECLTLAEEVETLTEGVIDVIADALETYANCHVDKEIAKRFISFSPLEPYRQTQALFRSHFDLYTARKFTRKQNDSFTDEDLRTALAEARNLEDRLSDAALAYIESKAALCGEQAKLELVSNYTNVHPSQITTFTLEAQSALELLSQEEAILDQQVQSAVRELATYRTQLAVNTATRAALAVREPSFYVSQLELLSQEEAILDQQVQSEELATQRTQLREQVHSDLSHLLSVSHKALALDRLLYGAVRHSLRGIQHCAQFAAQLAAHAQGEADATRSRIGSMAEIISAQESATQNLKNTDILAYTLSSLLGAQGTDDVTLFTKLYGDLRSKATDMREDVEQKYRNKEDKMKQFKTSLRPLRDHIFNGCTRQPNCSDHTAATLTHALTQELQRVESTVLDLGGRFTAVKSGDKQHLRKLWQWFLTDPPRLVAALKNAHET